MTTTTLSNGQTLDNATILLGNIDLQTDNTDIYLQGTLDAAGTYSLASGGDSTDLILDSATVDLTGGGIIQLSDSGANRIYGISGTDDVLINNDTIQGSGQLGINNGNVPLALTNATHGVIDATGTNAALIIQPSGPAVLNQGLMEDTGTAGLVITNGAVIDQSGGTILASGAGDNVYLQNGAAIAGGVLKTTGGGLIEASNGGATLDGSSNGVVTIAAASTVQLQDNQNLFLLGTIDNLGTLALNSTGDSTNLILNSATVSLTGGGVVLLSNSGANRIYGNGSGTATLINVNNIIEGAGQLGQNNVFDPLALTNEGTINADDSASLVIQPGGPALLNKKLMEATGTGGLVVTNGATIDQSGGTLLARGAGDNVYLQGGASVAGGLLLGTLGGIIETANATLDGTTTGAITIGTSTTMQVQDNTQLDLLGTIDILGTLALASTGDGTNLILTGTTVSLTGGGFVQMSDNPANRIYGASGSDETLINVKDTIEGAGQIGENNVNSPLALINETAGVINANAVNNALVIQTGGPALVNNGLIEVTNTGGLLITNGTTINQTGGGKILATGTLDYGYFEGGADILGGTLLASNGGEFFVGNGGANFGGPSTTSAITIGTATTVQLDDNQQLNLYGVIDNLGTLALDSTNDSTNLVLQSATVTLTGGGVVLLSDDYANRIFGNSNSQQSLINLNNTIEGAGDIGINNGSEPLALTNKAVIDATGTASLVIEPGGPAVLNEGLMEATGAGGLVIANNAVIDQYNGPSAAIGTLLASGAGNDVYLQGNGDIVGGLLNGTGGGEFLTSNATLDGSEGAAITIGTLTSVQVDDNTNLYLLGTINNTGTLALESTNDGTNLVLQSPTVTLTGGGVVLLSNDYANRIYGANQTDDTLINLNNTIEGAGQIGVNDGNVPLALTNESVIDANGTTALVIQPGGPAVLNEGLMEATGAGGLVITNGAVIDQYNGPSAAIGTLLASGAGDDVYLQGNADIVGGLLNGTGGGEFLTSNATLDGSEGAAITIGAATSVQIADNTNLYLLGTLDNTGTLALDSTNDGTNLQLESPTVVLTGGGVVLLSDNGANRIYGATSTDATLINVNNTIEGAGQIGVNDGNVPLALTNESVIDANGTDSLVIQPGGPPVLNEGLMEATGIGGLVINHGAVIDQYNGASIAVGTILASGSGDNVYLDSGADVVGGLLLGTGGGDFLTNNATLDGSAGAAVTIGTGTSLQVNDNTQLDLLGTIDILGILADGSTGDTSDIILQTSTVILAGGGVLQLSNFGSNRIYGATSNDDTLINHDTIEGAGQLGVNNGNVPLALTNAAGGLIDANDSNALVMQPGGVPVVNESLMEATGAGGLVITGGAVIDQYNGPSAAVGTILASGTGDNVYIQSGADIVGGLLRGTAGGLIEISNGTLDGSEGAAVTIGTATSVQLNDNSNLYLFGTINNLGTLSQDSTGDGTAIILATPTVSLTGGGVLLMSNTQANQIYGASQTDETLVNVSNTIQGAGRLGINNGNVPLVLINDGVIDADVRAGLLIQTGGPSVTNAGLLEATAGGILIVDNSSVTNTATGTIAAYDSSTVQFDSNSDLLNEGAGTLTGGAYAAYAVSGTSSLLITGSGLLAVDAANIILSGTGAEISFWNGNTYAAVEASLTEVTGAGTLQVDNGKSYGTTNILTIDTGGHIDLAAGTITPGSLLNAGTIFGYGAITSGVSNAVRIEANGGTLAVAGSVAGAGSIVIDAGAAFQLGGASGNGVLFEPGTVHGGSLSGELLILQQPSLFTGTLTSLAPGDTIDLVGSLAKSATISGSSLIVSLTAGGTLSYALAGTNAADRAVTSSDSHGGTNVTIFAKATAGTIAPKTTNFGEKHAGSVLTETFTLGNTGSFDQYSEYLDATMGSHGSLVTDSGSFKGLQAGGTNSTALKATLASTTAGVVSGTAAVNLYTDGTGVPGDGLGSLSIGTQTVTLTGTIFNFATADITTPSLALGEGHVGGVLTQLVTITNHGAPGSFTENLDAGFSGTSADLTGSGNVSELAAGATNGSGLHVTLTGGTAGVNSGSATIGLISDGSTIDTLGTTTLASQTVTATGTLFNYATAAITPPAGFEGHVGAAPAVFLTIANAAAAGIYSENLDASLSGTSSDLGGGGGVSELAAGGTSSSGIGLSFTSGTAGVNSGTAVLGLISDGSTIDTLGTTTLGSQTITLTGTLFNEATASVTGTINNGEKHVGQLLKTQVKVGNTAKTGGFSENLDASVSGTTSGLTGSGAVSELAAGQTNSTSLFLTLNSGTAGLQTGTATLGLISDGSTIDTLGTTVLTSDTITDTATLFSYATASTAAKIGFGIVHVGQSVAAGVTLTNKAAAGIYSENLDASFSGTTGNFSDSGAVSELAAGQTSTGTLFITLATGTAGVYNGAATLGLISDGAGIDTLGTTVLKGQTIALVGTVNNYATATIETISGPGVLTGSGTTFTLNLGTATKGSTALKENIGILNSATGPADNLSGSFTESGTKGFANSGFVVFSGKGAGTADTAPIITLTTGTLGTYTETIVLDAKGSNASGYSGTLAPETLIVTGTVVAAAAAVSTPAMAFAAPATTAAQAAPAAVLTGSAAAGQYAALQADTASSLPGFSNWLRTAPAATAEASPTAASAGAVSPFPLIEPDHRVLGRPPTAGFERAW